MTFERPIEQLAPRPSAAQLRAATPGNPYRIDGRPFSVSDVKSVTCVGAQGELNSAPKPGTAMLSMDLHGPGLEFATLELDGDSIYLFSGRYVDFAECRFSGLRALEGWSR
jgi:hypothetical protein